MMSRTFPTVVFLSAAAFGLTAAENEHFFAVHAGEEWQLDWAWREVKIPAFAYIHPLVSAYDADGRLVYESAVGQIQQRTFGPEDMSVQRWRVYAGVAKNESGSAPVD